MNTHINPEIKQKLFNKGWRYELTLDETGQRVENSLAEQRWNEGYLTYVDIAIAEVVMWLYEKHGIWISVECDCYGELWYSSLYSASKSLWEDIDKRHKVISAHHSFPNEHDTLIKAYEAAFEYTLNNLI